MSPHRYLACFTVLFALYISQSHQTPIHNHLQANSPQCPSDTWFQYQHFCVQRAPVGSERAVALYCDGIGGIGVSGLCVIKAALEKPRLEISGLVRSSELSPVLSSPGGQPEDDGEDEAVSLESEEGVCPSGWAHYRSICVYKPWSSEERCFQMGAVQFRGMCLKHAEPQRTRNVNDIRDNSGSFRPGAPEKRICCCAHPGAKSNGYAC